MYNEDILINKIKSNGFTIPPQELKELSLSESYVGKSDQEILQALVDLDLLLKKFFFQIMKKSKEEGKSFFKLCHNKMKGAFEFWALACNNDYERNKLKRIYENSLFVHEEFYTQKSFATNKPLITVLMPTYNSENYIAETLWSVFDQSCQDFELLIMNEKGSSPETTEVIKLFEDDRIRLVQNKTKLGLAESLNEGIRIAKGKYIARIDADDLATVDRFEVQKNFLDAHEEYGLCGSRQHHFGVDTDFVHEVAEEHDDIKAALIYGCEICHSTIMIRREYFLKNNLFYDNTKKAEDYELWTRAVHKFKFHNIKKVLGEYRVGAENITKNKFNALSAESALIAANNISKYLNVPVSEEHLEYLTGWENRFEQVGEKERQKALKEEETLLREMAKNNKVCKNYKDSSLLITINRRWRWVLGKYAYGHDLDEVLSIEDLFEKYPSSEEIIKGEESYEKSSFSLKQCIKKFLKFFYTPFKHGINYKIRQQIWDLDGHLKDSTYDILNNVRDSKYDILNHIKDSETRLKQHSYLVAEKNNNELYIQFENSLKKLEEQCETLKCIIESQNTLLRDTFDSRIYKAETNLGQAFDSRIYKAETNIGQAFDSRIYKAETSIGQNIDGRIYKAETSIGQNIDGRIYKAETNIGQALDSRIYKAETNIGQALDSRIYKAETNIEQNIDGRIYKAETNIEQNIDGRIYKAETNIGQAFDSRIYESEKNLSQTFDSRIYETEKNLSQTFDGRIYETEKNLSQTFDGRIYETEKNLSQTFDSRIYETEKNLSQTFDGRIYEAEKNLIQNFDGRIYEAEKNLSQTFDSRVYKAEENLSQNFDGRIWQSELYLKKEILSKIWVLNRMLSKLDNSQKGKNEYGTTSIYGSNFYEDNQYGSYVSAIEVLKYVMPLYKPSSIVDFGCGTGTWLAAAKQINREIQVIGVDGDYVDTDMLMIEKDEFLPRNLSEELDLHRKFDIAMSLEVAEHLEEKCSDVFVDTLCRHSDIILFSAAHVGQGGDGHVNEQPISYWIEKFKKRGYIWKDIRDVFKANYDIEQWYRDNISMFIKEK